MLSDVQYVRQSLGTHLFFIRIMKEHSFFLEVGFTPRDHNFTTRADQFRLEFDRLLGDVIPLSNGIVSPNIIQSGEVVTPYTLNAEIVSSNLTGVQIQTNLTRAESNLVGGELTTVNAALVQRTHVINQRAIGLVSGLIQLKTTILSNVLACNMFTVNYPLLIDHIRREARLYLSMIQRLQRREEINIEKQAYEQEAFWNRIMAEHSKFIRGLLDPTEEALFEIANEFGNEFDELTKEAKRAMEQTLPIDEITENSLKSTLEIRDFNTQATEGLLGCKIRSIIIPLLGDHVLRESNHFIRLLKEFEKN